MGAREAGSFDRRATGVWLSLQVNRSFSGVRRALEHEPGRGRDAAHLVLALAEIVATATGCGGDLPSAGRRVLTDSGSALAPGDPTRARLALQIVRDTAHEWAEEVGPELAATFVRELDELLARLSGAAAPGGCGEPDDGTLAPVRSRAARLARFHEQGAPDLLLRNERDQLGWTLARLIDAHGENGGVVEVVEAAKDVHLVLRSGASLGLLRGQRAGDAVRAELASFVRGTLRLGNPPG